MVRLPTVPTAQEVLDRGFRRAKRAQGGGRTPLERGQGSSLARIHAFTDGVRAPLRRVYRSFPSLEALPPFERELVDVLAGLEATKKDLGALRWAELQVTKVAREARARVRRSDRPGAVEAARKTCYGRISSLVNQVAPALDRLGALRNALRKVPSVDSGVATVVVAGAPNVGKSLLVRGLSRARPAVASYPFTTHDLSLGHFEVAGRTIQVMDTPGLLDRPLEERSEIERKAVAALRHAADLVLFLLDPTGTCGYPLEGQESLLEGLRGAFPATPFLEVENKADLGPGTGDRLRVSALTGEGLDALRARLATALREPSDGSVDG